MSETDSPLKSLIRIQEYDADGLAQMDRLGRDFQFDEVVYPAKRLISLFQKIPTSSLDEFANNEVQAIKSQADSVYNLFEQVMSFEARQADAEPTHQRLINQIEGQYQPAFTTLYPFISYAMARTVDFSALESQGRTAIQAVKDQSGDLMKELADQRKEAGDILQEVRKAASEKGVSQQSKYFADEASAHREKAENWRNTTIFMSIAVGLYGIAALFFHRIPLIAPESLAEAVQFVASKILIFFVLAYMLFLSARNFLSHRHNEIVNKHRQNALMTYKALVDAGGTPETRDIVLNHAAASIYKLHDTGYIRGGGDKQGPSSSSVVEFLPKANVPLGGD